jgi:hypothetical protein
MLFCLLNFRVKRFVVYSQLGTVKGYKSISSHLRSPRPNSTINSAGMDETLAWGAPNF